MPPEKPALQLQPLTTLSPLEPGDSTALGDRMGPDGQLTALQQVLVEKPSVAGGFGCQPGFN